MFDNAINIQGRSQKSVAGGSESELLLPGVYDVWADADCYIKLDQKSAMTVTSSNGYLLRAGNTLPVQVTSPSFIGVSAGATLKYHQVK